MNCDFCERTATHMVKLGKAGFWPTCKYCIDDGKVNKIIVKIEVKE